MISATMQKFTTEASLSSDSRRLQLVNLLAITEKMLDHSQAGNWGEVAELEAKRSKELQHCLTIPVSEQDSPTIVEAIATLLYLNEEVMSAVAAARQNAAEQSRKLQHTRKSVDQYRNQ